VRIGELTMHSEVEYLAHVPVKVRLGLLLDDLGLTPEEWGSLTEEQRYELLDLGTTRRAAILMRYGDGHQHFGRRLCAEADDITLEGVEEPDIYRALDAFYDLRKWPLRERTRREVERMLEEAGTWR
jgi:uncharacterized protein YjiS (DUF1127 family)